MYSFALSLSVVLLLVLIMNFLRTRLDPSNSFTKFPGISKYLVVFAVLSFLLTFPILIFTSSPIRSSVLLDIILLIGFLFASAGGLGHLWISHQEGTIVDPLGWYLIGFGSLFVVFFQSGIVMAGIQMEDTRELYSLSTKSGVIINAKILRTSSSGFIVYSDRSVQFIPLAEIRSVKTEQMKH